MFVNTPAVSKRYGSDRRYGSDKLATDSNTGIRPVVKNKISLVGRNVLVVGCGHTLGQRSISMQLDSDFQQKLHHTQSTLMQLALISGFELQLLPCVWLTCQIMLLTSH